MNQQRGNDVGETEPQALGNAEPDRRTFLAACGRFSAVTPPAITLLLSTSLTSGAIAKSGGGNGNNGFGNGGGDGSPNGFPDGNR